MFSYTLGESLISELYYVNTTSQSHLRSKSDGDQVFLPAASYLHEHENKLISIPYRCENNVFGCEDVHVFQLSYS